MKTPFGSYTFTLRRNADGTPVYQVRLFTGRIVAAEWPDEGSALAGAETEERRTLSNAYSLGYANPHAHPDTFLLLSSLERAEFNRGLVERSAEEDAKTFGN